MTKRERFIGVLGIVAVVTWHFSVEYVFSLILRVPKWEPVAPQEITYVKSFLEPNSFRNVTISPIRGSYEGAAVFRLRDGKLFYGNEVVGDDELKFKVEELCSDDPFRIIIVLVPPTERFGLAVHIIDLLHSCRKGRPVIMNDVKYRQRLEELDSAIKALSLHPTNAAGN